MKVLAITDLSGHMVGGPTTAAIHLLNGLTARGHSVTLASDHPYPGLLNVDHVNVRVGERSTIATQLATLIEQTRPDVVHLLSMGQRTLRLVASALSSVRWVLTVHSVAPFERILNRAHNTDKLHYLLRNLKYAPHSLGWRLMLRTLQAPAIVVHSPFVRKVLVSYGAPSSVIHVIDLAVEEESGNAVELASDGAERVVTVAGIAHTKGLHDAIQAIGRLRRDHPSIHYRIVGEVRDANYLAHLNSLIQALGLEQHVRISERVSSDEKNELLARASVYLQPSHEEGFCLAYLEASLVVPRLVGTDTGAIQSIGQGDASFTVVKPKDVDAMVHALAAALSAAAPSLAVRAARRRRLLERFSWQHHVQQHEALYRSLKQ